MTTLTPNLTSTLRYEAERLKLSGGFTVEALRNSGASEGHEVTLSFTGKASGTATGVFNGPAGKYQVRLGYFDENDGTSPVTVTVAGKASSFNMDQNLGANFTSYKVKTSRVTHDTIDLKPGDPFTIVGGASGGEFARIDYLDFQRVDGAPIHPASTPFNLSLEAEAYKAATAASGHTWNRVSDPSAYGQVVMQAGPDTNAVYDNQHLSLSPRLDYTVNFSSVGTYHVWLRGKAVGDLRNSNSIHLGLDGQSVSEVDGLGGFGLPYRWVDAQTVSITSPGTHTLNVWMSEDGLKLDSLFVTSDLNLRPTEKQAIAADKFVNSIGVGTHLNYYDTAYGDFNRVKSALSFLGIKHITSGINSADQENLRRINELFKLGIKLTSGVPYKSTSIAESINPIKAVGAAIEAIVGPNEPDIFDFSYKGLRFPTGVQTMMRDLYTAVKNDPVLGVAGRNVPVIQSALGHPWQTGADGKTRPDELGNLSAYADYGNTHNYYSWGNPPSSAIDQFAIDGAIVSPDRPMIATEGGYHTATNVNQGQLGVTYDVHGRYMTRFLLEQFNAGYQRTFVYELLDLKADPAKTNLNYNFGLFDANGVAKPAAIGISNMIKLLQDPGPAFTPKQLNYTLQGLPSTVHSLLLQKRNGHFFLALWNDADNWDETKDQAIHYSDVPVHLKVNQSISQIRTYRPLTNGTTALTTLNNTNDVTLQVPDHPLIIELTPAV